MKVPAVFGGIITYTRYTETYTNAKIALKVLRLVII